MHSCRHIAPTLFVGQIQRRRGRRGAGGRSGATWQRIFRCTYTRLPTLIRVCAHTLIPLCGTVRIA